MLKSFKKRSQKKAAAAAAASPTISSPTATDYSTFPSYNNLPPPRAGIFIAAAAPPQQPWATRQLPPTPVQQQNLNHVLPPASDYRQSLIMPHLTRRFTLLRAPDGSLVSPDAMRAHLRAQRARARAANVAIGAGMANHIHFLTEDEENAIIEQLKQQARAEGRDFDLEDKDAAAVVDSWRNGYAAGTDGFGSWAPQLNNDPKKLSILAESFGDLSSEMHDESARSPPRALGGGSLFTGRSADRDQAFFRNAQTRRNNSKEQRAATANSNESSQDTTATASTQESQATTPHLAQSEAHGVSMPGSFDTSKRSASPELPFIAEPTLEQAPSTSNTASHLGVPGFVGSSESRTSRDSNLLTTLSPESFKRVSTALDEVFGLIASERGNSPLASPMRSESRPNAESSLKPQRSSLNSDAISFTSAVSNVRALQSGSSLGVRAASGEHDADEDADKTITEVQPSLNAVHIEQGHLSLLSPIAQSYSGPLPGAHPDFVPDLPTSQTVTQLPSLVASESSQTIMDGQRDVQRSPTAPTVSNGASASQHLSVSSNQPADSGQARPSDRSSTATATGVPREASRIVSTASTLAPAELKHEQLPSSAETIGEEPLVSASPPEHKEPASEAASQPAPAPAPAVKAQYHFTRTPEMNNTTGFFTSPAYSDRSRNDSIISGASLRSSLVSGSQHGNHSRKGSADKLALARSVAPHAHLREQPSLSSVRRNYRQHIRSQTGSSEGSMLGGQHSRRSSGAMSPPPVLSRSARSPNYFPPPSSQVSMSDYAVGFKPPSAISSAAAAALQSMNAQTNQSSVMDASNALRNVQSMRNSASTNQSIASPHLTTLGAFTSGSERAAANSSPETGTTSVSVHQRNASLSSAKQQPQSSAQETLSYALRSAPVPPAPATAATALNEKGLLPTAPSDPDQADRWRAIYGNKATDAGSRAASADDLNVDADEDDLWARMASASEPKRPERPESMFPPSAAEERLAGTGITIDQIADFQDRLIQTASGGEGVPPIPSIQTDESQPQSKEQKFADAKSKGLALPNMVFGGSDWSEPPKAKPAVKPGEGLALGPTNVFPVNASNERWRHSRNISSTSQDPPLSPRAVQYDVTTSHRPMSPSIHSRNGSLNGLPSLLELNGAAARKRESFTQYPLGSPGKQPLRPDSIIEHPESTNDSDVQYAIQKPVQNHPYNAGYSSPDPYNASGFTFPPSSSKSGGVDMSPKHHGQAELPEDVWDRFGPQTGRPSYDVLGTMEGSPMMHSGDPTRLLDDVAAQTSAATRALKGTDSPSAPVPPVRTKSISRKKSLKKISKQISSPQLISTTQKLDHATVIPQNAETPSQASRSSSKSRKSPGWGSLAGLSIDYGRGSHKASPSATSSKGSTGAYFHRRRSSSFGHEASPDNEGLEDPSAAGTSSPKAVHPNHPYMNGGANGGSLSRLFSKIKRNKNDQFGGGTIEPFPADLSSNMAATVQTAPKTPEMPPPPLPLERGAAWTMPRTASNPSTSGNSVRSPTSPMYTLPIDSTSVPRRKSYTKKRTPIQLKRESEVVLPGEMPPPVAVIGRSSGERRMDLADVQQPQPQSAEEKGVKDEQRTGAEERMDYLSLHHKRDSVLAPVAAAATAATAAAGVKAKHDRIASIDAQSEGKLGQQSAAGDEIAEATNTTIPSSTLAPTQPTSIGADNGTKNADEDLTRRQSLRNTIVRRTIIMPSTFDFNNSPQRRSVHANAAVRRSRLPNSPTKAEGGMSTVLSFDGVSRHAISEDGEGEELLNGDEDASFGNLVGGGGMRESSYAGSLYDYYIGGEGEGGEDAVRPQQHIEVTERADGSVVWQVIAGLKDGIRSSVYSDTDDLGHLTAGDGRASFYAPDDANGGLLGGFDEDKRSLFTKKQAKLKSPEEPAFPRIPRKAPQPAEPLEQEEGEEVEEGEGKKEVTRIVYHDDAQLASLINVLSKGKDSAKFEFQITPSNSLPTGIRTSSAAASERGKPHSGIWDGDDVKANRSRVEAEIYTLLRGGKVQA